MGEVRSLQKVHGRASIAAINRYDAPFIEPNVQRLARLQVVLLRINPQENSP
jgi:hypothetical protein